MEQSELEKEVALLKKDVSDLKEENKALRMSNEKYEQQQVEQRILTQKILGKLDLIESKLDKTEELAKRTDSKSKIDIMTIIVAVIASFLCTGGADMLKTLLK